MNYENCVVLHIDEKSIENLNSEILLKYFTNATLTGGGKIINDDIQFNREHCFAYIYYEDVNAAKRVLENKKFIFGNLKIVAKPFKPKPKTEPIYIWVDGNNVAMRYLSGYLRGRFSN